MGQVLILKCEEFTPNPVAGGQNILGRLSVFNGDVKHDSIIKHEINLYVYMHACVYMYLSNLGP